MVKYINKSYHNMTTFVQIYGRPTRLGYFQNLPGQKVTNLISIQNNYFPI